MTTCTKSLRTSLGHLGIQIGAEVPDHALTAPYRVGINIL
jgi:hypothetical protein